MIRISTPEEWRGYFGEHSKPPAELFEPAIVIPIEGVDVIEPSVVRPVEVQVIGVDPSLYRVEADPIEIE